MVGMDAPVLLQMRIKATAELVLSDLTICGAAAVPGLEPEVDNPLGVIIRGLPAYSICLKFAAEDTSSQASHYERCAFVGKWSGKYLGTLACKMFKSHVTFCQGK